MDVIARWHIVLGVLALAMGCIAALGDRFLPTFRTRTVAIAVLVAAVLGGWSSARSWPWWACAAFLVVFVDDDSAPHPLGRAALPLTVLSLIGVWSAVPDTEPALAAGAILAPLAALRTLRGPVVGPAATAALVVAVSGAVWVGSAGWGAALSTACVLGLVAWAPVVMGFGTLLTGRPWAVLVASHAVVVLVLPRLIMVRSVPVAVGIAIGVSAGFLVLAMMVGRQTAIPVWRLR